MIRFLLESTQIVILVAGKSTMNRGSSHTESSIYTGVPLAMFDCQRVTINKMRDKAPSTFRYSHDKFSLLEGAPKL